MADRDEHERGAGVTAWPAPIEDGPALLVGGTFDPVHLAHVHLAVEARRAMLGDAGWLVYVPAARSPFKQEGAAASDAQRVEMLRIALRDVERAAVWTDEIDRARGGEATYWVDTLERAREVMEEGGGAGSPSLRFLIGADQAVAFHKWRAFREVLEMAAPIVVLRGDVRDLDALRERLRAAGVWTHMEIERWLSWVAPTDLMDVCATSLREALGDPALRERAIEGLDEEVRTYIVREGLYL